MRCKICIPDACLFGFRSGGFVNKLMSLGFFRFARTCRVSHMRIHWEPGLKHPTVISTPFSGDIDETGKASRNRIVHSAVSSQKSDYLHFMPGWVGKWGISGILNF